MHIKKNYPGGNIDVVSIQDRDVFLKQEQRDSDCRWFYWNFSVEDAGGREVAFHFTDGEVVGPFGPAVSEDGFHWRYRPEAFIDHRTFRYRFEDSGRIAYFAFCIPYQVAHFTDFIKKQNSSYLTMGVLGVSEQGRDIPMLRLGKGERNIVFTCRHHCCESTGSYALEGMIRSLCGECAGALERFTFHIFPFIDVDGVENGDQGKGHRPHDHNRDYTVSPLYRSVKLLCEYTEGLQCEALLDMHSPYKWGNLDDLPHVHECPETRELTAFLENLTEFSRRGGESIRYVASLYRSRSGGPYNPADSPTCKNFFYQNRGAKISVTVETPYSGALKVPYTPEIMRRWGAAVIRALLSSLPA